MESNKISAFNKSLNSLDIEPIPNKLKIHGFILMIVIFLSVLVFASEIKIPMQYLGSVIGVDKNYLSIRILENHKIEFLPEIKDTLVVLQMDSNFELGKFCVNQIELEDKIIKLKAKDKSNLLQFNNEKVKIISQNVSLFTLVFRRFYK